METKLCSVCNTVKAIEEFHLKRDKRKDKLYTYRDYLCLSCKSKRDKKYKTVNRFFLEENKRQKDRYKPLKPKLKKIRQTDDERRAKGRELYYANHKENLLKSASYYYVHREERRKAQADWRLKNPGYGKLSAKYKDPDRNKRQKIINRILLEDQYVKDKIRQHYGLSAHQMTPDLVKNYRMQIKVKRLLKQMKNENTETC
jgi:hypothetical protein